MNRRIEISPKTIFFTVIVILSLGLIYLLKDVIMELFVALLLMAIINPVVVSLSKYKIPKAVSVLVTYFLVVGIFIGMISLILPAVIEQTTSFIDALPAYLARIGFVTFFSKDIFSGLLNNNVSSAPGAIFQFTFSIVNNIIAILTVLVFAFYMLLSRDKIEDQLGVFFGNAKKRELGQLIDTLEKKLGGWARGELILMVSIGFFTYLGLSILGIPYALPLGVLGGILEIIPYLGPILSAVPSVLIGFGISPLTGLGVAALTFLIHQLENYILVPKVMEKSAGVSPLLTLIALVVGARLAGTVGAIISVPVLITLQVIAKEYWVKE